MVPHKSLTVDQYIAGVLHRDRSVLAQTITLVESRLPSHREMADKVLTALQPRSGESIRVGVTGVPGVGKSTFIEALGKHLTGNNHKVAVLAVDPTSVRTGGSILGDKTRMQELSRDPAAFIRPSPTSGTLGGVARATRESMIVCEAAGFDIILIETVGVGQSEITVADMVDFFLALMLPGAGDELQGIKKGLLEIADMIAVNKADGDMIIPAQRAAAEYRRALEILTPTSPNWSPPTQTCSAVTKEGLAEIWEEIQIHRRVCKKSSEFESKRRDQQIRWMWSMIKDRVIISIEENSEIKKIVRELEKEVSANRMPPGIAAERALAAFRSV